MTFLYRRLLGQDYERLPASLQDFHHIDRERHFQARFKITRGPGLLRALLCRLGRLPASGENVPMRLRVTPEEGRERWVRQFGEQVLESVQWEKDGLLHERLGPVRLAFKLHVEPPALRLELKKAWGLGIRLPLWLAPGGSGIEVGQDDGVAILVRATAPILGQLVQYEGLVQGE